MITTSDAEVAERARVLRFHGSHDKVTYEQVGYNSRLDELQAAILRVQLPHLDGWADGAAQAGRHYEEAGLGELVALPRAVDGASPAWHLYVVGHPEVRAAAKARSPRRTSATSAYYRTPVHRQAAMREWGAGVELPGTEQAARTHLAIPMSPVLTREQAEQVVAAARRRARYAERPRRTAAVSASARAGPRRRPRAARAPARPSRPRARARRA